MNKCFFVKTVMMCLSIIVLELGAVRCYALDPFLLRNYQHYNMKGDYAAALNTVRKLIKEPGSASDLELSRIRLIGVGALSEYGDFYGLQEGMDEEAQRYYRDGLALAKNDALLTAQFHHAMALYYSKAGGRNGLALPYTWKELDYWKKTDNTYQLINTYFGLSCAYSDMGQLELRDHYETKTMDLAKTYFVLGKKPTDQHLWLQYNKMLKSRLDHMTGSASMKDILAHWQIQEPIVNTYLGAGKYQSYYRMAIALAEAGEISKAKDFLEKTKEIEAEEQKRLSHILNPKNSQMDLAGYSAHIHLYAGEYEEGIKAMERAFKIANEINSEPGASSYRVAGLLYEGAGDLDGAIRYFRQSIAGLEVTRSSFAVADRIAFFNNSPRKSYWGLIRCYTKKYLKTRAESDFLDALQSSELVRGRSFGEMLDQKGTGIISAENLRGLISQLGRDDVLVDYMFMGREMVVFVLSQEQHGAFIIPYDEKVFRAEIVSLIQNLSRPDSDLEQIHKQLQFISRITLSPFADLLKRKKRIIVLPDGLLNAVPFDLMTLEDGTYRPLIEDREVVVAPSLKYLVRARKSTQRHARGLFALADPVYAGSRNVRGVPEAEMRGIDRSGRSLAYFAPLPETRSEVEKIAVLYKGEKVKTLLGQKATRTELEKTDLRSFGYIHFATHGILGGDVPGVEEPALVLAQERNENSFLLASEAEKLKLDSELAVLSACNTGTGRYFTGEGVMGISRSFLLAGSRSVLVSLWSVPSRETEQLMVRFYKNMRSGIDAPAAVRKAKLEMIKMPPAGYGSNLQERGVGVKERKNITKQPLHPFYWASFILFGGV